MKNGMMDLNNILFEQLERLNDEDLDEEGLEKEIKRSKPMVSVAQAIIANADTAIKAQKMAYEYGDQRNIDIPLLGKCKE